jgi:hypothetical protein
MPPSIKQSNHTFFESQFAEILGSALFIRHLCQTATPLMPHLALTIMLSTEFYRLPVDGFLIVSPLTPILMPHSAHGFA